jgi:hypothetical protein
MLPLYHDPHFTFRFDADRIIPRFHLEGVEAGRRVSVFRIDPDTGERLGLLTTATVGEGGWVALPEPIIGKRPVSDRTQPASHSLGGLGGSGDEVGLSGCFLVGPKLGRVTPLG